MPRRLIGIPREIWHPQLKALRKLCSQLHVMEGHRCLLQS
ncbi:hypothetical protein BDE02_08G028300 [Populus trichocarpa]|nr:hypothetical protein BDE02_08G028300 [Populus trichocarpa]